MATYEDYYRTGQTIHSLHKAGQETETWRADTSGAFIGLTVVALAGLWWYASNKPKKKGKK